MSEVFELEFNEVGFACLSSFALVSKSALQELRREHRVIVDVSVR